MFIGVNGVGKTTTAINLSAALAQHGMKVLAIDSDPQGNCTSGLGIDKSKVKNSVYQMIIGKCDIKDCILDSIIDGFINHCRSILQLNLFSKILSKIKMLY